MTKKTTKTEQKYFMYKNGKKREVSKEEFEKHYPAITETEETATTE